MNSGSGRKTIYRLRSLALLSIATVLVLLAFIWSSGLQPDPGFEVNTAENRDLLAYISNQGHLMLYDPLTHTKTTLLEGVDSFVLSRDGRVAFTKLDVVDTDVYVLDPAAPSVAPVNISQNPDAKHKPLAWHHSGQYLAYTSYTVENNDSRYVSMDAINHTLLIWDGETTRDAMLEDGQLAFSIVHPWIWDNVPPLVQWHVVSDAIIEPSTIWEGDATEQHLVGLTKGGQVRFSFTLASGLPSYHLVVRNAEGRTLFGTETGNVSWSRDGYLAYCRFDGLSGDWILSVWNGRRNWDVAMTSYKPIQWQNGETTFSCNSG